MGFIRIKTIKGQKYAYLVENKWTAKGARQKVAKYLGRVYFPQKKSQKGLKEYLGIDDVKGHVRGDDFCKIINDLVALELHNHGMNNVYLEKQGNKVIALNQGFLCEHTMKQLLSYNSEEDDGFKLAELITGAGINVEKEVFVELFDKMKKQATASRAEQLGKNFYY